jgi:GxxExxY protein
MSEFIFNAEPQSRRVRRMPLNDISKCIVDAAIEVHRNLGGPGLLENVYEEALAWELLQRGFMIERQLLVPIIYKGNELGSPLRLDLLIEKSVVVEVKATSNYNPIRSGMNQVLKRRIEKDVIYV